MLINQRLALRRQSRQAPNQRMRARSVAITGAAVSFSTPLQIAVVAFNLYVGPHALQFENVLEAILKNGFGNRSNAIGNRVHRAELRLHIGWKSRVRQSL